jgi:hypothetical protein
MTVFEHSPERFEYYRNKEFSALDSRNSMEDAATPQPQGNVEGKPTEEDPISQEREQQLDIWMSDIKAFIRNIDVSKL